MIHVGDCLEVLKGFADNSIDSVVCDPPYGISFMAKRWDYQVPSVDVWLECLRALKPGGHMLAFGGTRTYHRLVVAIEDAGFEIRDQIQWLTGQGFPKSLNVGKATGSKEWEGWGTALKPANEPICLARKPLSESTVAKNVLKWGTGGINVDGCRVDSKPRTTHADGNIQGTKPQPMSWGENTAKVLTEGAQGRFPANLILDEQAAAALDEQTQHLHGAGTKREAGTAVQVADDGVTSYQLGQNPRNGMRFGDSGGASRFFYVAKASKSDRGQGNNHPTVKPTSLMAYLCRLITPPGGTVLDPFAGSGSTGVAAIREGFAFVGIEREAEYAEIAKARIAKA